VRTQHTAPSRDPAVVQYRVVVDTDMRAISFAVDTEACKTRSVCVTELTQIKVATEALMRDLGKGAAPQVITSSVERLKAAAQQFRDQVDAALVVVQQPNSNFFAAGATPTIRDLFLAAASVDCWPLQPVNPGGEGGYSCA
jgi:hypothetical protein